MEYLKWKEIYQDIQRDFSYGYQKEVEARDFLADNLKSDIFDLKPLIYKKDVLVCGAAPSLKSENLNSKKVIIAADGITSFFLEKEIYPDIIVTDLDGKIEDLIKANSLGSKVVLHAHGDNISRIKKYLPKFRSVYGTTQIEPKDYIVNFGGFTDGDRAIFLAEEFKPKSITLYGMDLNSEIGKYSYIYDLETKKKKLKWAEYLINYLSKNSNVDIRYG